MRIIITTAIARYENCTRLKDHEPVTRLHMQPSQVIECTELTAHARLHLIQRARPSYVDCAEVNEEVCFGTAAVTCSGPAEPVRATSRALHYQLTSSPSESADAARKVRDRTSVSNAAVGGEALRPLCTARVKYRNEVALLQVQPCHVLDRTRLSRYARAALIERRRSDNGQPPDVDDERNRILVIRYIADVSEVCARVAARFAVAADAIDVVNMRGAPT
jgi:hypothetical protein